MKEIEKLKYKVKTAVCLFMENDSELLTLAGGVHEQAISHRIAVYLEFLFRGLHVDCEYNKYGDQSTKITYINEIFEKRSKCRCESCIKWHEKQKQKLHLEQPIEDTVSIIPDIIVHEKRGLKDKGNTIVIEIKKSKKCIFDMEKLRALTKKGDTVDIPYNYKLGAFIYFPENKPMVKWFPEGEALSDFEALNI